MLKFFKDVWNCLFCKSDDYLDIASLPATPSISDKKSDKMGNLNKNLHHTNPDFNSWAFGDNYLALSSIQKMEAWNKMHGDLLMLKMDYEVHSSLCKMGGFWVQEDLKNLHLKE